MEAASLPPWATERGWEGVGRRTGAGFPLAAAAQPKMMYTKPKVSMSVNPWEGVLGPGNVESQSTVKTHTRADVASLIKTPKEVWKAGKEPTQLSTAPLPGTNAERAAAKRTPSHLRGNENASRGVVASSERLPDTTTIKATRRVWKTSDQKFPDGTTLVGAVSCTVRPKRTNIPASSMSMASLAALSAMQSSGGLPERAQSAAAVLEDTEFARSTRRPETEVELLAYVRDLKAQCFRLQQTAGDKEAELERLYTARDRSDKDGAQVEEADKDFDDFKQRIETRQSAVEDRLPDLSKQKHELDNVIKRLHRANKVMTNRLGQCR